MFKIYIKKNNHNAGFSLVEMLVATGIFMSIMTIAISSLISIIAANKKAQSIKSTIDSVTFAVENISIDMRMGTYYECSLDNVNFSNICVDGYGQNVGGSAVRYISSDNVTGIEYLFSNTDNRGLLVKKTCSGSNYTSCTQTDLISLASNINIKTMKFYVIGADFESAILPADKTQPRVVITASGLISTKGSSDTTSFNLQTSVSQRAKR